MTPNGAFMAMAAIRMSSYYRDIRERRNEQFALGAIASIFWAVDSLCGNEAANAVKQMAQQDAYRD